MKTKNLFESDSSDDDQQSEDGKDDIKEENKDIVESDDE